MTARLTQLGLCVLVVAAGSVVVAGQASTVELDVTAPTAEPGGAVTVTFATTNTGTDPAATIVNVTDRPDWEIANRTDGSARWNDEGKWLVPTIEPGATVSPALTLSVPEDATGEYRIGAVVTNGETTESTRATIRVAPATAAASGGETDRRGATGGLPLVGAGVVAVALLLVGVWVGSKR